MIKMNNKKTPIMKLTSLKSLKALNSKELCFVTGGGSPGQDSACWEDSTSKDSYKRDTGGCSCKKDKDK